LKKHFTALVGSLRCGRTIDEENSKSGVKTQTRIEGVHDVGVEAVAIEGEGGGWIWNLRTPTFSIR
jgi:hypothetical protein